MIGEGFVRHEGLEENSKTVSEHYKRFQENASFYHLSGDPELTPRDFERYQKSQERIQKEIPAFIIQGLKHGDLSARLGMIEVLAQVPEDQQEEIRKKILPTIKEVLDLRRFDNEFLHLLHKTLKLFPLISEQDRVFLINQVFISGSSEARKAVLKYVDKISEPDRAKILNQAFEDKDREVRLAAESIDRPLHNQGGIKWKNQISFIGDKQIMKASKSDQPRLIEQALKDGDMNVRLAAAKCIDKIPKSYRFKLLEQALEDDEVEIRLLATRYIYSVSEKERILLIEQALKGKKITGFSLKNIIGLIEYIQDSQQRKHLIQIRFEQEQRWKTLAKFIPLYTDVQHPFFHKAFSKTGSGTTLLDKVPGTELSLRERVIIRHIDVGPYQEWKRVYEDVEFWKKQGFEYVPIEPIVKASLNPKTYRVDVATRVLQGPPSEIWEMLSGLYAQCIYDQREKIKKALESLGVVHGHTHDNNFIVYFDRDEQGEPILDKPPRVYVIDFDQAVSLGK